MTKMTNEEIVKAIQAGNTEAINQLWAQCYGFIRQQASKWAVAWKNRPCADIDDLTQCGYMALCNAIEKYQEERGQFIPFLAYFLKNEFANAVGCKTAAQMNEPCNTALSLDAPAYSDSDSDITWGDATPSEDTYIEDVEDKVYNEQLSQILHQAMEALPEQQRKALDLYYFGNKTYEQVAAEMMRSCSRIGELVKRGLNGLRQGQYAPTLSDLLYGERNLYKHTGYTSWKDSGCSVQEWTIIGQERKKELYELDESAESKVRYCMKVLGWSEEKARAVFPA